MGRGLVSNVPISNWLSTRCGMPEPTDQHHQLDGPTSSLGPVSMGKERRSGCGGGLLSAIRDGKVCTKVEGGDWFAVPACLKKNSFDFRRLALLLHVVLVHPGSCFRTESEKNDRRGFGAAHPPRN